MSGLKYDPNQMAEINSLTYDPNQMAEINRSSGGGGATTTGGGLMSVGGAMAMVPGLQAVGAATSLAGLGLSAYGQYQANKSAEKNYQLVLTQYMENKAKQEQIETYNKQQNELANTMQYGQYASGLKKDARDTYGQYNTSIGA